MPERPTMKYFAVIFLLTFVSAYHADLHELRIYKRANFRNDASTELLQRLTRRRAPPDGAQSGTPLTSTALNPRGPVNNQRDARARSASPERSPRAASVPPRTPNIREPPRSMQRAKSTDSSKSGDSAGSANLDRSVSSRGSASADVGGRSSSKASKEKATSHASSGVAGPSQYSSPSRTRVAERSSSGALRTGTSPSRSGSTEVQHSAGGVTEGLRSAARSGLEIQSGVSPPSARTASRGSVTGLEGPPDHPAAPPNPFSQTMSRQIESGRTMVRKTADWAHRNPTTAALGGCAALGTCVAASGIGMLAAGAGATQAAGMAMTGIGGGLAVGTAGAAGSIWHSGRDGPQSPRTPSRPLLHRRTG